MQDAGIDHLHLPTVDFLFAPSVENLHRGVDFIAGTASYSGMPAVMTRSRAVTYEWPFVATVGPSQAPDKHNSHTGFKHNRPEQAVPSDQEGSNVSDALQSTRTAAS